MVPESVATAGTKMLQKCDRVPYAGLGEYWVTLALGGRIAILGAYSGPLGSDWLAEGWEGVSSISPVWVNTSHIWPRERNHGLCSYVCGCRKFPFLLSYYSQKSHLCR